MPISAHTIFSSSSPHILPRHSPSLFIQPPQKIAHFNELAIKTPSIYKPHWRLGAHETKNTVNVKNKINWDAVLPIAEVACLLPSAILSLGCIVNCLLLYPKNSTLLNKILASQLGLLVAAALIGSVIRERLWKRLSDIQLSSGFSKKDLVERIDKLEEGLRNSTAIIRVLSRQLEKLGIRLRVTRKTLKEPISEAANLSLKNSEATQALGRQKDILEKELGEIQKVLLAMQEQQQKQLELILAVAKAGKFTRENPL